ncbi:MAG: class D beta-lactamase [Anaerolineales bacterium]|nr:class D beta-lactamase [Anaerolineales bacterium]
MIKILRNQKNLRESAVQTVVMRIFIYFLIVFLVGCTTAHIQTAPTPETGPELESYFQGIDGAFVLYDLYNDRTIRYNPERCAQRFIPASTFKVLNSLIGLETGVITDENCVIEWDGAQYEVPEWNRDHTLQTAIQVSAVWVYQELARQVGVEEMQQYVDAAGYGNQDISGEIDTFWLEGGLRISADEQVEFLQRLYQDDLPFSTRSMDIVKKILVQEETSTWRLSGKTGSAQRIDPHIGWFVGYLEIEENVYFFATNYSTSNPDGFVNGDRAREITLNILKLLDLY